MHGDNTLNIPTAVITHTFVEHLTQIQDFPVSASLNIPFHTCIHHTPKEDLNGALYLHFALCSHISQALNLLVKTHIINVLCSAGHTHTHTFVWRAFHKAVHYCY